MTSFSLQLFLYIQSATTNTFKQRGFWCHKADIESEQIILLDLEFSYIIYSLFRFVVLTALCGDFEEPLNPSPPFNTGQSLLDN